MLAAVVLTLAAAARAAGNRPRLYTHQNYIEDITNETVLPLSDPKAMLTFVLESLPDRVKVYPTENYYYFNFYSQGVRYAGNIRLDMMDRDKGKLHFAYFEDLQEWKADAPLTYNVFDQARRRAGREDRLSRLPRHLRRKAGRLRIERSVEGRAAARRRSGRTRNISARCSTIPACASS